MQTMKAPHPMLGALVTRLGGNVPPSVAQALAVTLLTMRPNLDIASVTSSPLILSSGAMTLASGASADMSFQAPATSVIYAISASAYNASTGLVDGADVEVSFDLAVDRATVGHLVGGGDQAVPFGAFMGAMPTPLPLFVVPANRRFGGRVTNGSATRGYRAQVTLLGISIAAIGVDTL